MTWNISDQMDSRFYYTRKSVIDQVRNNQYQHMDFSPKYLMKNGYKRIITFRFVKKDNVWIMTEIYRVSFVNHSVQKYTYTSIPADYFNYLLNCAILIQWWYRDILYRQNRYQRLQNTHVKCHKITALKLTNVRKKGHMRAMSDTAIDDNYLVRHIICPKKQTCDCETCTLPVQHGLDDSLVSLCNKLLIYKRGHYICPNNIMYERYRAEQVSELKQLKCECKLRQRAYPIWRWKKPGFAECIGYTRPCYCSTCHKYRPEIVENVQEFLDSEPIVDYKNMYKQHAYVPICQGDFDRLPPFANFLQNNLNDTPYPTLRPPKQVDMWHIVRDGELYPTWNKPRWLRTAEIDTMPQLTDDMDLTVEVDPIYEALRHTV